MRWTDRSPSKNACWDSDYPLAVADLGELVCAHSIRDVHRG